MFVTSGVLRKERLTPDVRFRPWPMPFPGPRESSETISCRGFTTGIPREDGTRPSVSFVSPGSCQTGPGATPLTRGHQLRFVLLVSHLLLLHVAPREEEAHHTVEKLVCQLDGQRHDVHLQGAQRRGARRGSASRLP
uniref:Uncharacterized protein n=1 Tax=Salvator merianae TaxID=96440 RepID=A0A8D0C555_SALMN